MSGPSQEVLDAIPHRPPFLWVDEVVEWGEGSVKTRKFVDPEADFFKGHYPDHPITPGVLICEAIFQTGAILLSKVAAEAAAAGEELVPVMTKIKDTRFKKMVLPGDTLEIEVEIEDSIAKLYHLKGKAKVGKKLAVATSFAVALAPPAS